MPRIYRPVGPSGNKAVTPGSEKKENPATGRGKKGQVPNEPSENGKAEGGGT